MAVVALATTYLLLGLASFSTHVSHGIVTPVCFLSEGVSLAASLLLGPQLWPGVFLGQLLLASSQSVPLPVGLAIAYYFIPKTSNNPLYSHKLSMIGFWSLAFVYVWTGAHHMIHGPISQWLQASADALKRSLQAVGSRPLPVGTAHRTVRETARAGRSSYGA